MHHEVGVSEDLVIIEFLLGVEDKAMEGVFDKSEQEHAEGEEEEKLGEGDLVPVVLDVGVVVNEHGGEGDVADVVPLAVGVALDEGSGEHFGRN